MSVETPVEERAQRSDPESDREAAEAMGGTNGGTPAAGGEPDLEGAAADEQGLPPLEVEGEKQLSLAIGGAKPTKSTMKLRGGSINVPGGQVDKGQTINLVVTVVCSEVHVVDKRDGTTGEITETERRQIMKITGVEKVGGG